MEEGFYKRFQIFKDSLDALAEARDRDLNDSHMISDFPTGSPREVLRKAFETGLIDDDVWMEMLKVRNEISHDYDGKILKEYCEKIIGIYIESFKQFRDKVDIIIIKDK